MSTLQHISCPYCSADSSTLWGKDNGFTAVRCSGCGFVFVNPRPILENIDKAVSTGMHSEEANSINVVTKHLPSKVFIYKKIFEDFYKDHFKTVKTVSWLDVGAGFGEVVEAVMAIAPDGSNVLGIEPMEPKAKAAQQRGINVKNGFLDSLDEKFDVISIINVFSHIPDFRSFLQEIKGKLNPNGEIFIETGNAADVERKYVPGDLSLPDHLIFAGDKHLEGFLKEQGFEIIKIKRIRIDTFFEFLKDVVRKILGKPVNLVLPYTSGYRSLLIRAKLK